MGKTRPLNWFELQQVGEVREILVAEGLLPCTTCNYDVRAHLFAFSSHQPDEYDIYSGTRAMCDGSLVRPMVFSGTITRRQSIASPPQRVVQEPLF